MNPASAFLIVTLGGGIGAAARYGLTLVFSGGGWAIGTIVANTAGSFIIGIIAGLDGLLPLPPRVRLLLATGFCGGLTTMSTFVYETAHMTRQSEFLQASLYAGITLFGSFAGFILGMFLARSLLRPSL